MQKFNTHLTTEERILVNSEIEKNKKSSTLAWLLWFFVGTAGGHRYYMGKIGSAVAMTILTITVVGLLISSLWALIDAFLLGRWLQEDSEEVERKAVEQVLLYKKVK